MAKSPYMGGSDEEFGGVGPAPKHEIPAMPCDVAEPPDPALLALGPPPVDAVAKQKWHYDVLTMMSYAVLKDEGLTSAQRTKQFMQLSAAAARHYPEAAKYDLSQQLTREAEAVAGRKRQKAAAELKRRPAAGAAKVIPIRRDAQGS